MYHQLEAYDRIEAGGGIELERYFKSGESVFMKVSNGVREARVEHEQNGRFVVSYKGSGYEEEGHICVSGSRLFRTYDEAVSHGRRQEPVVPWVDCGLDYWID